MSDSNEEKQTTEGSAEVYAALNTLSLGLELIERAMITFASTSLSEPEVAQLRTDVNERQARLKALFSKSEDR